MRSLRVFVGFSVFALAAIQASAQNVYTATSQGLYTATCIKDGHIDAATRQAADSAAMEFAKSLFGAKPAPSALFAGDAQARAARQQLYAQFVAELHSSEAKNIAPQHTYLIKSTGPATGQLNCTADASKPEDSVSLSVKSVPEQAHVLISAETASDNWALSVWLIPEQDKWKVQSFWMNASSMGGKDSTQLWDLARAQRQAGHALNAFVFYNAALQTVYRGEDFQWGIIQPISDDMAQLAVPAEVQGDPPYTWKDGANAYKITQVEPVAISGKLYVMIGQEVEPWQSNEQVDGWNRAVIAYFKLRFPEYADAFAGIAVRAKEHGGNKSFGTVENTPLPAQPATPPSASSPMPSSTPLPK